MVGNIPELGEWSLKRGVTLKQLKSGQLSSKFLFLRRPSEIVVSEVATNFGIVIIADLHMRIQALQSSPFYQSVPQTN